MASGPQVVANLHEAGRLIGQAVGAGAGLVVLPENFAIMAMNDGDRLAVAEHDGAGPIQEFLASTARARRVWIAGGTIPIRGLDPKRVRAACLLFNDRGERVARYDKIHLFDVRLDSGEEYNESAAVEPGETVVVADTPFGRLGLAVCYDLRFPELFRRMLDQGAELFAVPSAFTVRTGRAHWELLVRARAVENLAYVVAAAQGGWLRRLCDCEIGRATRLRIAAEQPVAYQLDGDPGGWLPLEMQVLPRRLTFVVPRGHCLRA